MNQITSIQPTLAQRLANVPDRVRVAQYHATVTRLPANPDGNLYEVRINGGTAVVLVHAGRAHCVHCGSDGCVHVDALRDMPYREQTDEGRQLEYRESLRREGNFQALEALDGRSV